MGQCPTRIFRAVADRAGMQGVIDVRILATSGNRRRFKWAIRRGIREVFGLSPSDDTNVYGRAYAVADGRVSLNAAASVRAPTAGHVRREGQFLTRDELDALAAACRAVHADVVKVLGLAGLRWGEVAGLQVGDHIAAPGPGLRSVLASSKGGELFVDTLKGKRSRTVPLVAELVSLVDAWALGKQGPTGCSELLEAAR